MEIIVFTGIPASGKTTLFEKMFKGTYIRVSLSVLGARKNEDEFIAKCIKKNKSFVVDNTNMTITERKKYIDIAKKLNCKIINYRLCIDKEKAITRNNGRYGKARVKEVAIYTALKNFVQPSIEEGFNELYIVNNNGSDFSIKAK